MLCGHEGEGDHVLRVLRAATEMVAVTRAALPHGDKVQVSACVGVRGSWVTVEGNQLAVDSLALRIAGTCVAYQHRN